MAETESKIPACPVCGGTVYHVANTWTTKDGVIHRQRICALCEQSAYQSAETPEEAPSAAETVEKLPKSTANANLGNSGLTRTPQADTLTAKAGGRVPPWKRTRPPAVQPNRKG